LVIADNGSTDQTPQVLAWFASRLPLHVVCEPKLGKNHALNTGLKLLEGDLAVFTDDDAFPHADWLVHLRNAADTHLAYSVFGGAILPRWELPPPNWVQWVDSGPVYTLTGPSWEEGPIAPQFIFGPNMAVRTSVFQSGMHLDPSIGPRGSSYPMGSETEFILRLSRQGHEAWHVRRAVVEHLVREAQMKKAWVLQRAISYGRGYYRMFYAEGTPAWKLWMGMPRRLFRDIPKEGLLIGAACLFFKREAIFRSCWRFNFLRGQAMEARRLARQRTAQA
jgi:glycosyltransferase involved in cell wall biosynthesis